MHTLTRIPGDENGRELMTATARVLSAAGVEITWVDHELVDGALTDDTIAALKKHRVGLMGFHAKRAPDAPPPIVAIREKLGMFANVRPIRTMKGIPVRHEGIDLVLVRETTEDVYAHLEHESIPGVFESLKVTTRAACERIARHAFTVARAKGRKKVTIVHKANIMKRSDGMFLKTAQKVAAEFADIASEDVIVDALCMKLVLAPHKFDVLVAGNLYGDILADLCAGLVGGASNCPSINVGPEVTLVAAPHGDAPQFRAVGQGNLLGVLVPAIALLREIGEDAAADRVWAATEQALVDGKKPPVLGGDCGPEKMAGAVIERL